MTFDQLKPGIIAWLGCSPTDRRIRCDLGKRRLRGAIPFFVINGAWRGDLHKGENDRLFIIDERGTRHDPIFLVEIEQPAAPQPEAVDNEIPF